MKNVVYWSIEGQNHFCMAGGAKMNFFPPLCVIGCSLSNIITTFKQAPHVERNY